MKMSLKTKIRLNIMLLLIPFLLLIYFYYHGVIKTADEKMKIESQKIVNNISDLYIEEYINKTEQDFSYLFSDITINDFYNISEYSKIIRRWETYKQINRDAWYIYFATKFDRMYVVPRWIPPTDYDMSERPWYINAYSNPYGINWTQPYEEAVTKSLVVTASRVYRGSEGEIIGVGSVDLTLETLSNMLKKINIGEGAGIFIVDRDNKIIAHPQYSKVWTSLIDDEIINNLNSNKSSSFSNKDGIYYAFKTIEKTGWKVVAEIPDKTLEEITKPMMSQIAFLVIFAMILFFIIQHLITNNIFFHFNNISYSLLKLKKGNYNLDLENKKSQEVKDLYSNFSDVIGKINSLNQETIIDPLTNLFNRRYLERKLKEVHDEEIKYSVLMLDIDDFKIANDKYGHKFGDYVLKKLGFIIYSNVRNEDTAIRYGGEEFLVIFNGEEEDIIKKLSENIRKEIEEMKWPKDVKITVSGGLAFYKDGEDLIEKSDQLLYKSKSQGKNKIYIN
ncbi:MAG: sensor domain-containing diguanylate cyclase [Thermotogota bacterium]